MASIFTNIIRGESPAERLFETEHELAFLDIHPKSTGHTLVVPKLEVASFHELPPERAASLAATLNTVARAVSEAMGTPNYNLWLNNGAPAGQVVFHVHMHIIPRYGGNPFTGASGARSSLREVGARIRAALRALPPAQRVPGDVPED
jgi:histidine triad (HIT) family protein